MSNRPNMLINLPPPPSDPYTPNEAGPGTPNSTTTSISALSVVAIKDGAVGHGSGAGGHRQSMSSASTLEAERADRISRLAGLERVATVRSASGHLIPGPGGSTSGPPPHGMIKEISTVGSASATGSVGGKTTWAEQSEMDYDADKMSEDQDIGEQDGASSIAASDEMDKASLVGFGEGASSTISGPVNTANARMIAARNNAAPRPQSYLANLAANTGTGSGGSTPMSGIERPSMTSHISNTATVGSNSSAGDPKMMDGVTFDQGIIDTTVATPPAIEPDRFSGTDSQMVDNMEDARTMQTPPNNQDLGRFEFERK